MTVKITLEVTPEFAALLDEAIATGHFAEFPIVEAESSVLANQQVREGKNLEANAAANAKSKQVAQQGESKSPAIASTSVKEVKPPEPSIDDKRAKETLFLNETSISIPTTHSSISDAEAVTEVTTQPFRSLSRPPTPMLHILEQGDVVRESFPLYHETTIIGRTRGDIIFPYDPDLMDPHLSITRVYDSVYDFYQLRDISSCGFPSYPGSYKQVKYFWITDSQSKTYFMVGNTVFCFHIIIRKAQRSAFLQWTYAEKWISEMLDTSTTNTWLLGRDPSKCQILIRDDDCVSLHHIKIEFTHNNWRITDLDSCNGLWEAFDRIRVMSKEDLKVFRIGQHRFKLDSLGS